LISNSNSDKRFKWRTRIYEEIRNYQEMLAENYWLQLKEVEAWLGPRQVFKNLSISLKFGENTVILGPNGAGKSALVKLINRSIYPVVKTGSSLKIFGSETVNLIKLRKRIAVVSTELELRTAGSISGRDIVLSGLFGSIGIGRNHKPSGVQINKVRKIMEELELWQYAPRPFGQLSDGERRRLLIARALINNPEILVLDEPTNGLDLKARHQTLQIIRRISKASTTILMVTHQVESIVDEIQRVLFISQGKIIGDGPPKQKMKSNVLSNLYGTPLDVSNFNGYWQVFPAINTII